MTVTPQPPVSAPVPDVDRTARALAASGEVSAPAAPAPCSRPRPGFSHPDTARKAAEIFVAGGFTAADVRAMADPGDMLFSELADAVDAVAAEGLTPAQAAADRACPPWCEIVDHDDADGGEMRHVVPEAGS